MNKLKKIARKDIEDIFALTSMQEGMLFHYLKDPESDYYFEQLCLTVTGEIDLNCFKQAWNFVIKTNEMLRTVFQWEKMKDPVQMVLKEHSLEPGYYDFSNERMEERQESLEQIKIKDRKEKFDLQRVPFRVTLCKMAENKYEMLVSNHHILYDGWSSSIILGEFFQYYHDLCDQKTQVTPVKNKFKEYIKWLQEQDVVEQEEYWREYLKGFDRAAKIPVKRIEVKTQGTAKKSIETCALRFTGEIKDRCEHFVRKYKITLAALLYTSWGVLLQKYNNNDDVIFGATVSGRSAKIKSIENMVGLFINTLPLRVQIRPGDKISDLLDRINKMLQIREKYESTSLVRICAKGELFDSIVVIENYPLDSRLKPEQDKLSVDSYSMVEMTHYDLTISITILEGIDVSFVYNEGVFDDGSIINMSRHFRKIILDMVSDPGTRISDIEIITGEEKEKILYDFNKTGVEYPRDKTIHHLFEEQVARTPDRIAVAAHSTTHMTYDQLNKNSNQMAHLLKEKGVGPDTVAAIMVESSIEMVVGILGILKAGGAYLPIDPNYPAERVKFMLADSAAEVLVTTKNLFKEGEKKEIIYLDNYTKIGPGGASPEKLRAPCSMLHASQTGSSSLAYIIYTSGTTGRPKGVVIQHGGLVNYILWRLKACHYQPDDVTLQLVSYSFDGFGSSFYSSLLSGGSLVLVPESKKWDVEFIRSVLWQRGVTNLSLVPGMYDALVRTANEEDLKTLRLVVLGGDRAAPDLIACTKKKNPRLQHIIEYGPTEATVTAAAHINIESSDTSIIGTPIANTKIVILDRFFHFMPMGVPGELCIAGIGLARGYLNDPGLTAERFNRSYKSYRTYKTGDLACWLHDGNIEFLGRIDNQVKIRGFRIEPEEVEKRLMKHKNINDAVVVARKDENGENCLTAYIVLLTGTAGAVNKTPGTGELREYLFHTLPDYMIPSYFVYLDSIPLTVNGKVDRKALPEPGISSKQAYVPPRNETEEKLVEIWSEVLGAAHTAVGIDHNFFELGGHSLKATRLVSRIHKELNTIVPISKLFEFPSIRGLARHINKAKKRIYSPIGVTEKKEYYRLSSAQKRLHILQQVEKDSISYNMTRALILEGEVDRGRLEKTFRRLIERHESFRTSFDMVGGKPVQRIYQEVYFRVEYYSASSNSKSQMPNFIRPFDLSRAPLFRVGLVKLEQQKHRLMVDMHHIISDGISAGILIKDFMAIYAGEELPPIRIRYRDFSEWQNSEPWKEAIKDQEAYWLRTFAGDIPVLELPTDFLRPTVQQFEGRRLDFEVGKEETIALQNTAFRQNVTLYMVLLTLLYIFLSKISNQEDIVIGTATAGRKRPDLENIIGMFVNTLAIRNFPEGENTFQSFLGIVKESILEAFENQDYPFEELVENLSINRDTNRNPLFDVMFALQDLDIPVIEIPGLRLASLDHDPGIAKFDLTFTCEKAGESLLFSVEYSTRLFQSSTIERFAGYFKKIITDVTRDTAVRISDVEIMSQKEKEEILYDFNDTKAEYPTDKTIHELFEEQVEKTPDGVALVGGWQGVEVRRTYPIRGVRETDVQLTYRALNNISNQLAYLLKEKGVAPGTIVGIMVKQSIEMVIGILGILKAGGAYLPIEPDYPEERIKYMLEDSNTRVLVSGLSEVSCKELACLFPEVIDLNTIRAGGLAPLALSFVDHPTPRNSQLATSPKNLAYVIYTSGTTGRPKGVIVEQRNVVRLVKNTNYIHFKKGDRLMQTGVLAFDASTFEIWGALLNGLELYLAEKETLLTPEKLKKVLHKYDICTLWMTSPLFNQMVDADIDIFNGLRNLLVGGDVLSTHHINRVRKKFPSLHIINGYGPTENTTFSTTFPIDRDYEGRIPIGKPIANSTAYIVDKYDNIVPIGVTGELWVGGDGVARGYLNNPELTAEKFDQDFWDYQDYQDNKGPVAPESSKALNLTGKNLLTFLPLYPSTSLYRTGDLARWLSDGTIEFIGRVDYQVKIRGFRIELGEIENQLLTHEKVREAKVIVKEMQSPGGGRDKYLCAYIVPPAAIFGEASEQDFHMAIVDELKDYLSHSLPDFMIPGFWVILEKIPLTTNGKVDIKSLPEPDIGRSAVPYAAPQDEIQQRMVKIWVHVLDLAEAPGIDDNFFQLGGHSLKATAMVQHVYKEFAANIEIEDVFTQPTLREMAQRIKELEEAECKAIEIKPVEEKEDYSLSHAQRRLWVLCQLEKDATAYNMPAALTISGSFKVDVFTRAVQALADRHESLRTLFILKGGEPRQKIINDFIFDLEQVDLRSLDEKTKEEKARHMFLEDANRAFNLEHGPLFRFKLVRLEDEEYLLIHNMHHIVNDGWSQGIITNELSALYNTFLRGGENPFSPLVFQYKDYSQWHNRLVETDRFKRCRDYWVEKFQDKPNGIECPLDHPRKAIQTFNGGRVTFIIDREKTARLHQLSFGEDATLFMSLLTLLIIFLYRYSGKRDIIIGAPIANRKRPELHPIIGFFVNTLIYRSQVNPERSFMEQLRMIKEEALACYRNQDYPFDLLVEQLELDRDLSQSPLFNVMLAHNNTESEELGVVLEGVTISNYTHSDEFNMSKFDLLFFMDEMDHRVCIRLEYNSDLFERPTIERMSRNFLTLVDHIVDNDGMEIPISALKIISSDQYERILRQFNATCHPFPPLTLLQMLESQAEESGEKTALVYNGEHMTYKELDQRANRLAHYLREEFSVQPNDIIGVSLDRSIDMIVTLLGIMKSGAAYLALDPSYPESRILYMLQDSQANVLVKDKTAPQLFRDYNGSSINIRSVEDKMAVKSTRSPAIVNKASDILYVTYTSGSTGKPNGAVVSHDILTNLIRWQKENTSIDGSLRCLQFASINFDVSFQEIMSTLTAGGELHLIGEMERKDIDYLMDFLRFHCIEILYLPFYYLNFLFTETDRWSESYRHSLKHLVTAGEQLIITPGLKSFLDLNLGVQLHNHYGPAEMHVVTSYTLDASTAGQRTLPPIGKPISNVKIYILDESEQPVPIGVWGEIYIVGPSSFVGYLNKPDLTDKKLLKAGVGLGGKRMYRTGDIGRWMEDGHIELKGRKDFQVKIRGFRIEPSEIESKILAVPQVKECVVVVKENEAKQKYLVAYAAVEGIEISEIRQHISRQLPQYMIPQFVVLDSLPLLPNGKVDRDKLPEPELKPEEDYIPPGNPLEEKLVQIWSEVLGIEETVIGVNADFFQLGGHSLKAAAVVSEIHKELDAKVELVEIFKSPTIRGISALIKAVQWAENPELNANQVIEEVVV